MNFDILEPDINFSDHFPITATCKLTIAASRNNISGNCTDSNVDVYRWDHADLVSFYHYTGVWLQPVLSKLDDFSELGYCNIKSDMVNDLINEVYYEIVNVLCYAANLYVPKRKRNYYKFWWDQEMSLLKEKSIESNNLWKQAGKPRSGPIFDIRQKYRSDYRKALRNHSTNSLNIYTNELHDSLMSKNGPVFLEKLAIQI